MPQSCKARIEWDEGRPLDPFSTISRLHKAYLCMVAWEGPHWNELDEQDRTIFSELVAEGLLFNAVENLKRDVLRSGATVPDAWLRPLCAASIRAGERLPAAARKELDAILRAMWPMLCRLEVNGEPGRATGPARAPKAKRGTKAARSRKIDVAITIKTRDPHLSDAEVAAGAKCDPSYLSRSKEYRRNADLAERALVRAKRRSTYDNRTETRDVVDGYDHEAEVDARLDGES